MCGLVTFEDLIEAVLAAEINDEFDAADANHPSQPSSFAPSRRSATRRIVDPRNAKASTLNEMLKGLTILAEQKGYSGQPGTPRQQPKIPLMRSQTSAHLYNKKKGTQSSPAMLPRERVVPKKGSASSTPSGSSGKGASRGSGADRARSAMQRAGSNDSAYVALPDLQEEDENAEDDDYDDVEQKAGGSARRAPVTHFDTTKEPRISSAEPGYGSRSRSAITYSTQDEMAIYTPLASERRAFFPTASPGSEPVLVEETMSDGTIRVTIASDRQAAVQHIEQLEKDQDDGKAYDDRMQGEKRDREDIEVEEARQADPFSTFVNKLLSSADHLIHKKDDDDDSAEPHHAHRHNHHRDSTTKSPASSSPDKHEKGTKSASGRPPRHSPDAVLTRKGSNSVSSVGSAGSVGSSSSSLSSADASEGEEDGKDGEGDEEEASPQQQPRMTGLPAVLGMPDRRS